jgi:transposase
MSDEEWEIFQPFLMSSTGRPPKAHRRVLDGVFWIARTGSAWRDLPAEFGKWNSVWRQFRRWVLSGVFDIMLEGFADSGGKADML